MRKTVLAGVVAIAAAIGVGVFAGQASSQQVTVYKSPTCGCCSEWVTHLRSAGFDVDTENVQNLVTVKLEHGISAGLGSCHTALIEGYVIEGHVPAEDIQRLLEERPDIAGLSVPGMPVGSPGMEGPNPVPYDVLAFDSRGNVEVFASHGL